MINRQRIDESSIHAVAESLKRGAARGGESVEEFEKAVAEYCGVDYAIAFSALPIAYQAINFAINVSSFDRVVTTGNVSIHALSPFLASGATPVFVDIDDEKHNASLQSLSRILQYRSSRGRHVILLRHYKGIPAPVQRVERLLTNPLDIIIEDGTDVFGSHYINRQKIGSCPWSDMTLFNFDLQASLNCLGGGMITTKNKHIFQRLRLFRDYGYLVPGASTDFEKLLSPQAFSERESSSMLTYQADLGLAQLKNVNAIVKRKQERLDIYQKEFSRLHHLEIISNLLEEDTVYSAFLLRIGPSYRMSRDQLWEKLQHKGVAASLPCAPVYRHPFIKSKYRIDFTAYPYLDKFCETVIELPIDPLIKIDELVALCHTFKKILR